MFLVKAKTGERTNFVDIFIWNCSEIQFICEGFSRLIYSPSRCTAYCNWTLMCQGSEAIIFTWLYHTCLFIQVTIACNAETMATCICLNTFKPTFLWFTTWILTQNMKSHDCFLPDIFFILTKRAYHMSLKNESVTYLL